VLTVVLRMPKLSGVSSEVRYFSQRTHMATLQSQEYEIAKSAKGGTTRGSAFCLFAFVLKRSAQEGIVEFNLTRARMASHEHYRCFRVKHVVNVVRAHDLTCDGGRGRGTGRCDGSRGVICCQAQDLPSHPLWRRIGEANKYCKARCARMGQGDTYIVPDFLTLDETRLLRAFAGLPGLLRAFDG
jgi:hypothetical protein